MLWSGYLGISSFEPYHRLFSLEDKSIQYTYAERERVPMQLAALIVMVGPLATMTFIALVIKRSMHDWHHSCLGFALSMTMTLIVTEIIKNTSGRPRPDFIDRCQPIPGAVDSPVYGLSNSSICTQQDPVIIRDGFKSLVSGHASTSFAGMGYLSLYLAGKLHVFDRKGYTYKSFTVVTPLIIAVFICISRTQDYRHHWQDVLAGSALGFVLAIFSYYQYYPNIHSPVCDKPYSVRIKKELHVRSAEFQFTDGSNFIVKITREDGNLLYQDNRVLLNDNVDSLDSISKVSSISNV
ncbi:9639_t:CDS:2 [Entrophospora sp. SA101]|nr:9639_t:CDS:2 [Entrophospora sp. SA101]CAJ0833094.1 4514_t:CDS:2 [Entrophospora sp. SA101]CAJ0904735.1 15743_t:CDS:2 [Entrophospora sp. SA101]